MHLRLVLSSIMLLALAANPGFAKDSHAQRGARTSTTKAATSGKATSGANPAPSKANVSDAVETVAPPVLPSHGVTPRQARIVNPSAKNLVNAAHGQASAMTNAAPAARNAIGQPVVASKNFAGTQPSVSLALRAPRVGSPPIASPNTPRVNVANATNRGSVNGATMIRPTIAPSAVGGPAQARSGINGTTVQKRH